MPLRNLRQEVSFMFAAALNTTGKSYTYVQVPAANRRYFVPPGEAAYDIKVGVAREQRALDANEMPIQVEVRTTIAYQPTDINDRRDWLEIHLWQVLRTTLSRFVWRTFVQTSEANVVGGPEADFPEDVLRVIAVEIVTLVELKNQDILPE